MLVEVHRLERAEDHRFRPAQQASLDARFLVHFHRLNEKNQRPVRMEKLEGHLRGARPAVRPCHLIAASGKADPERV